ncbi:MAG: hypothetical protein D3M94_20710 [Rhodocyclales bacterium GT-UBC]|nr:MAG: hypothetical protein D3M94_20710 [Rhodocyclales bacterium GT-UBC]
MKIPAPLVGDGGRPRIFVSMASYRDPEGPPTLADMYAKARFPERIFTGVLWQVDAEHDRDCYELPDAVPVAQVRSGFVHPQDSLGACWARHSILSELRAGEEFVLQIDSHMRFVEDWDEKLLAMWARCRSPRAVLSSYPVAYSPPHQLAAKAITILCPKGFNHRGILTFEARSENYELRQEQPMPNAFVCGGFLFAPGAAFDQVPYDPYLYFHGEEISLSARLWTHGWDPYTPDDVLIYHYYGRAELRPRHWADNPDWGGLDQRSLSRLRHLFGMEVSNDPKVIEELDRFGLGSIRTLAEYEKFADVAFAAQRIGRRGASGHFPPHPDPQRRAKARVFENIYAQNTWGCSETSSGPGATRGATRAAGLFLRQFIADKGIHSLLDAGCGDVNWAWESTQALTYYFGIDLVADMIDNNQTLHGWRKGHFFSVADICRDPLPRAEAILCRHVLTHQPNEEIVAALRNFVASGAVWLICNGYEVADNADTQLGFWRPIDLTRHPFALPEPEMKVRDGAGAWLGAWSIEAIRERVNSLTLS